MRKRSLLFVKWKDKREVSLLTNIHDAFTIVKKRRSKSGVGGYEETVKPTAIEEYNKYMSGVDRLDQILSYYSFNRRTNKWWRKGFFCLLDIGIYNSFVCILSRNKIIASCPTSSSGHNSQENWSWIQVSVVFLNLPAQSGPVVVTSPSARLVERHFPDELPSRQNGKPGQRNCVVCSSETGRPRKTSTYYCKICGVGLCVVPCFELHHTKTNPSRYI